MKKIRFCSIVFAASLFGLIMAGCQKDTNTLRLRMDGFNGPNGKIYMNQRTPVWNVGDVIRINNSDYTVRSIDGNEALVTIPESATAPSYAAYAPYPTGANTYLSQNGWVIYLPGQQVYEVDGDGHQIVKAPMIAYTTSTEGVLNFHNTGALLAINVNNNRLGNAAINVTGIRVSSADHTIPLWGSAIVTDYTSPTSYHTFVDAPNQWNVSLLLAKQDTTETMATIAVGDSKVFYIHVPAAPVQAGVSNRYRIVVEYTTNGSSVIDTVQREQLSTYGGCLNRNQMAAVPFDMRRVEAPDGAIAGGKFTINSSRDQVWFSAGNLQYGGSATPANCTWRIAPHQYDWIGGSGSSNGNVSGSDNTLVSQASYAGWVDLFGWATSGWDNTANDPLATRYLPKECAVVTTGNNSNYYGYGPSVGRPNAECLNGVNANHDWGVYNTIYYNGEAVSGAGVGVSWRTLTYEEWQYILCRRSINGLSATSNTSLAQALHHTYSYGSVAGVYGILIYHDDAQFSLTSATNKTFTLSSSDDIPSGCVFLPLSGLRSGTGGATFAPGKGYYWSASATTGAAVATTNVKNAVYLSVAPQNSITGDPVKLTLVAQGRYYGSAVRLVTPVI